jgi:hypothetical protein
LPTGVLYLTYVAACYLSESRFRPLVLLLLPIAFAAVIVASPFWQLGLVCGLYLERQDAVSGSLEDEGLRLQCQRQLSREWLSWREIRSIRWKPGLPLGEHFLLCLRNGSEIKIHSLPFDNPLEACEQIEIRAGINSQG